VGVRAASRLLARGVSVRDLRRVLDALRRLLPESDSPLAETRLAVEGRRIVVEQEGVRFEPRTGQTLLGIEAAGVGAESRAAPRPGLVRPLVSPDDDAEGWFRRASLLDQDPASWELAVSAYERVVAIDPACAAAWNNLGRLHHRMARYPKAAECYRAAREAEEGCHEAAYNLGALSEDLGDLTSAMGWYRLALELAPDYPDAHFNLAGALAKAGRPSEAARHWRRYLELDLASPWAEIARAELTAESHGKVEPGDGPSPERSPPGGTAS
jgi:tetratricopeptide (TPR) repeat protein